MKIRITLTILIAFALTPTASADDSEKLDAILKELRDLKERVTQLEKKVESLSKTPNVSKTPNAHVKVIRNGEPLQREPIRLQPLPRRDVEEVLRLQIQSPGSLLKGIHEREMNLRNRIFLPDVFR